MPMRGPEKARGALAAGLERLVRSGERSGLFEAHLAIGHGLSQAGLQPRQAGSLDLRQHVAASWVCGRRTASASSSSYIRRSRLVGHHAGQPAPDVVFGNGVDTLRRVGLRFTQFADAAVATIRLKLLKLGAQVPACGAFTFAIVSGCPDKGEFETSGQPRD